VLRYKLGYGVIPARFLLNRVTGRVGTSSKVLGLGWLAAGPLLGRTRGEGNSGRLCQLQGEAKF
jgi:hypothetical protein